MNKKYLWTVLLLVMIQSIGLSQTILKRDSVKYHCYTNYENRIIGITILEKLQQDTLINLYQSRLIIKDSIIKYQYIAIGQQDTIINKQSKELDKRNNTLQKMKYYKYGTWGFALTTLIFILL